MSPAASSASHPLVPGHGVLPTRDPEPLPPNPATCWNSEPSSTAHQTISCSEDRARSATPAAEDFRRRASSDGLASTRSPRPALVSPDAHLSVIQGARRAAPSWSSTSTAAARRKHWLTWYPGPSRRIWSGMAAASPGPEPAPLRGSGSASAAPGSKRRTVVPGGPLDYWRPVRRGLGQAMPTVPVSGAPRTRTASAVGFCLC